MNEIECLYCSTKTDGITANKAVDAMKKHVKEKHPTKPQI